MFSDPLACSNNNFRQATQTIREGNWSFVTDKQATPISCQDHQLSTFSNLVGDLQVKFCHLAENQCQEECQVKLNEFKEAFKSCFRIPSSSSLDDILKKAKNPKENQECYQQMTEIAEKYKVQSLDGKAVLKEELKVEDFVKCKEVNKEKTQANLMKLTKSSCQIAKAKQEQIREEEKQQKAEEEAREEQEKVRLAEEQARMEEEQARLEEEQAKAEEERKKAQERAKKAEAERLKKQERAKKAKAKRLKAQEKAKKVEAERLKALSKKIKEKKEVSDKAKTQTSKSQSQSNKARSETTKNQVLNTQTLSQEAQDQLRTESTSKKSGFQSHQAPETIHLAQASNNSGCPISMPEIDYVTMFQSVEAPQKEPMRKQAKKPNDNFDIVTDKYAGILVKLKEANMDPNERFKIVWYNAWADEKVYHKQCFHQPLKKHDMELVDEKEKCVFKKKSLGEEGLYKLFPIIFLRNNKKFKNYKINVLLYSSKYFKNQKCHKTKTFNVTAFDLNYLDVGLTRIEEPKSACDYQSALSPGDLEVFSHSREAYIINSMFPMRVAVEPIIQVINNHEIDYAEGFCNNYKLHSSGISQGLLTDISYLDSLRANLYQDSSGSYDKIVAIASKSYFAFHHKSPKTIGFMIRPSTQHFISSYFLGFIPRYKEVHTGGSWNVLFIREDQKDTGTLSHELAHTLGQVREFYDNKKACRPFNDGSLQYCREYEIPRALDVFIENKKRKWNLIEGRFSIMSNQGEIIDEQWIDRDSYQKILSTAIRHKSFVIDPKIRLFDEVEYSINNKQKRSSLKAVLSGFYYEKKDRFILPKTDLLKNKMKEFSLSKKVKTPTLTFQLKEGKKVLQQIRRPVFDLEMEVLYENKAPEQKPFPFFHTRVAFKLPKDYKQRNLRILVYNPKKKLIYSTIVPKKESKKSKSLDSDGKFF